ncbi:hypothetical protein N7478_012078 [Penicillium angulare]|uniref:uncharacterized protein n=1 Tax=Penicillium angulare TaxID=116970 RepID=UPI002540B443|nr:uncharacterized protein N7478_012078 [Penicillium angulare]KAJ5260473.1 hypothetical protein N7478_012078 [Penicillium angulare]
MRFLCLHGMGTSSDIFSSQLGVIIADLERLGHEFVFVDGLHECNTSSDVAAVYPGPYLCYYPLPTPELVRAAHEQIFDAIAEEGPIDAIISFSQGAALAASILLQDAKEKPHEDMIGLAVFISASLPFDLDDETGADIWRSTQDSAKRSLAAVSDPLASSQNFAKQVPTGNVRPGESCGELSFDNAPGIPDDPYNFDGQLLRRYHPMELPFGMQIQIPSLHIFGNNDPYVGQARLLVELCDERMRSSITHSEGHSVPRGATFRQKVVKAISSKADGASFHRH